jgi:tRNA modification GTPase
VERFGGVGNSQQGWQAPALVSSQRGTTRDYLTAKLCWNGYQCELVDTAGIEAFTGSHPKPEVSCAQSQASVIDDSAQMLASEQRKRASIRSYCVEAEQVSDERRLLDLRCDLGTAGGDLLVLTKADMLPRGFFRAESTEGMPVVFTSSRSGLGLEEFCAAIGALLATPTKTERAHVVAATADRCRETVKLAGHSLKRAADLVLANGGNELVAVELRTALNELGSVVGAVYTNDLLDRIFGTFCIGK